MRKPRFYANHAFLIHALCFGRATSPLMKRYLLLLLICCFASANVLAQVLTQQDVVKLLELKIPEQTIVEKVKTSGTSFVLGTEDIARLKKAGASDALLAAMESSSSSASAAGSESSEITD